MSSPVKKILVTIAGGKYSLITAKYAIGMAKFLDSKLFVQYVVNAKALADLLQAKVFVKIESIGYEKELEDQGNKHLENIRKLAEVKQVQIETILSKGVVHEEVVQLVKELNIDILVMGELKEFVFRKDSFYDEGERIFREVRCPVLVVKGDKEIEKMYEDLQ
jgi:nucleotide-binding universal stress UspA family protein